MFMDVPDTSGYFLETEKYPDIELMLQEIGHAFQVQFIKREAQKPHITPEVSPEVTPEVAPEVRKMLSIMIGEMTRGEIQEKLGLKDEKHFREKYQQVAVKLGLVEMTIPGKPRSSKQKYRLTEKGRSLLERLKREVR